MCDDQLVKYAVEEGFAAAAVIPTEDIVFDPAFRPYCEENLCGQYDANYSCPPECGSPEAMKQKILAHKKALVLQTIWEVEDYSDSKATKAGKKHHNMASQKLMKRLRHEGCGGFMVGASGCSLCSPCRIQLGEPCTFPDLRWSCMSAYCVFVRKLAESAGMEYNAGPGLIAFFGMYICD